MTRKSKIIVVLILLVGSISIGIFSLKKSRLIGEPANSEESAADKGKSAVYHEATCLEAGYWIYENPDGSVQAVTDGAPLGHQWENGICVMCGEQSDVQETALPQVRINGSLDGISKENRVLVPVDFLSDELQISCYGYMSTQGHSTLNYPKKNYTLRLYNDTALTDKHSISFNGWQKEHKYILKAYMDDTSMVRDLVCADIWANIVSTRQQIPAQLKNASNYGAVAGFPVTVWLNGEFLGLYSMNLHKDNDLYRMSKRENEAIMICNAQTMPESLFRAEAVYEEDVSDWELEFTGDDGTRTKDAFNNLIRFVMTVNDEDFKDQLHYYLDVDAAIDYLLFIWTMGLSNNGSKDLVMLNYGEEWIPSAYDMEDGIGLACDAETFYPSLGDVPDSATGSLLWDRLLKNFMPELQSRYAELRKGPLSENRLLGTLETYYNRIPQSWRVMDLELYPGRAESSLEQMQAYLTARLQRLDTLLER